MENKEVVGLLRSVYGDKYNHLEWKDLIDQVIKDNNLEPKTEGVPILGVQKRNFNNASHNAIEEIKAEAEAKDLRVITFKELNKIILLERKIADQRISALEERLKRIEFTLYLNK